MAEKSSMGADGCGYSDAVSADAANDLATFSSRGPCSDGRQKPDLVAPGHPHHRWCSAIHRDGKWFGHGAELFSKPPVSARLERRRLLGSTNNFFPLGQQFYTVSSALVAAPAVAGRVRCCADFLNHISPRRAPP